VVWPTHPITLPSGKVSIVPLGDSITQGGRINGEISYRYPLWKKLVDADASFDMVGSETGGFNGDPSWPDYEGSPFDREHEGHWGITMDQVRDRLPGWLAGYRPDVALVLLGTNDGDQGDQVDNMTLEAQQLFEQLRAKNPHLIIVWGQPAEAWDPYPAFRSAMEMVAEEMTAEASPIILVDHSPGWVSDPHASGAHTIDWVHTNPAGDEKLAANWMTVLRPLLRIH